VASRQFISLGLLSYTTHTSGSIGTTKKGIGPAYSSKASRSGLRVHHLFDNDFADKFRKIVEGRFKRYGHFEYDTEKEIERYKVCLVHSNATNVRYQ
jgi:adenylosuccinate synthase